MLGCVNASSSERPARSDARRNRARLIEVAAEAFRDEGLDVGVDELARRAGVGIATLYRHFPAKPDLIQAVTERVLDELEHAAAAPGQTVAGFLDAALRLHCRNRGFLEALAQHDLPSGARDALTDRALAILAPIVATGHRSGEIRDELDATDLLVFIRMLGAVAASPRRNDADRYLDTLLRGLAS
jgi:AcrR family transcriptional regulator